MTFDEFVHLTHENQLDFIKREGSLIGEKETDGRRMMLYQMVNFYVEVCHDENAQTTKLRAFTSLDLLDPYLEGINISRITKNLLLVPLTNLVEVLESFILVLV